MKSIKDTDKNIKMYGYYKKSIENSKKNSRIFGLFIKSIKGAEEICRILGDFMKSKHYIKVFLVFVLFSGLLLFCFQNFAAGQTPTPSAAPATSTNTSKKSTPAPGSYADPLVSKSYVESQLNKLKDQINTKLNSEDSEAQNKIAALESEVKKIGPIQQSINKLSEISGQLKLSQEQTLLSNKSLSLRLDNTIKKLEELTSRFDMLYTDYDKKLKALKEGTSSGNLFVRIAISPKKTVVLQQGTEIILLSGNAKVQSGKTGGLINLAGTGKEIANGAPVTPNQMFLSAASDGRGIHTATSCVFMIRGYYTIK